MPRASTEKCERHTSGASATCGAAWDHTSALNACAAPMRAIGRDGGTRWESLPSGHAGSPLREVQPVRTFFSL